MTRKEQAEALLRELVRDVAQGTCELAYERMRDFGRPARDYLMEARKGLADDMAEATEGAATPDSPYARLLAMVGDGEPVAWRPIDTAPKDGTPVLIAREMGDPWGWVIGHGRYHTHGGGIEGWISYGFHRPPDNLGLGAPTHWMPLPTAPGAHPPAPSPCESCAEWEASFDLYDAAVKRATEAWRAANPDAPELMLPDTAKALVALYDEMSAPAPSTEPEPITFDSPNRGLRAPSQEEEQDGR